MRSFFSSIRTKTAVLFFVVFLVIILPVHWVVYKKIKQALVEANYREMKLEAEKLLGQVRLDPFIVPLPAEGYLLNLQVQQDFQSENLFASPGFPMVSEVDFLQTTAQVDTLELVNVSKPLEYSNSQLILSLARSSTVLQQQLASLQLYLFVAIVIAISLAAILVFMVSGWILRPIKQLALAAVTVKTSKDIHSIPLPATHDESRQLAESINAMLERIQFSVKEQTNFFASAAHELRTPLAVMKTELTLATQEIPGERILSLLREVERLERVIHDFLLISELKADVLAIRKKSESFDELLYTALKKVRFASEEYETAIQVKIEENVEDFRVVVDADKMETVIANLVENAIKYTVPKSVVTIELSKEKEEYTLSITNPIGQSIENPALFLQEFKKANALSSGLGMGLWICDQIVKLHGGKLILSSSTNRFMATLQISGEGQ